MPVRIKLAISVFVALIAVAGYFFQDHLGQAGPKYAALFLGALMIGAMWLFPEVKREAPASKEEQRQEAPR